MKINLDMYPLGNKILEWSQGREAETGLFIAMFNLIVLMTL